MDNCSVKEQILKSLVAPARYSDGPTLFLICQKDDGQGCSIYEQLADGQCQRWPESSVGGVQQAEGMIYQQAGRSIEN